jgi:hypothetical protein
MISQFMTISEWLLGSFSWSVVKKTCGTSQKGGPPREGSFGMAISMDQSMYNAMYIA